MKGFLLTALLAAAVGTAVTIREGESVTPAAALNAPSSAAQWDSQTVINTVGYVALQHDSIKKNADSIRLETCRGGVLNANGTCSGRKIAPRTTYLYRWQMRIQHHAYRADSSLNQLMIRIVPPVTPPNVGYVATVSYNSDSIYLARPGVDTVTVCAVITDAQGVKKLGWPVLRLGQGHADSTGWGRRGGNPLEVMCRRAIEREGVTSGLDSISAMPVNWSGSWVDAYGRRLFRPFFAVP